MNNMLLLSAGAVFMLMLVGSGLIMLRQSRQQDRYAARVRLIHGQAPAQRAAPEPDAIRIASMRVIAALGQIILRSGVLSASTRAEFEHTLAASGLHGTNGLAVYVGAKIMLAAALPVMAIVLLHNVEMPGMLNTLLPPGAGIVGLMAPDWVLGRRRKRYQHHLELGLPDALDMMVICAQAGLGLGPTVVRVATELQNAHWEVAQELAQTANELQMVSDSRIALINLGSRTGIEAYKRLGTTLIQTMQYGTPLTEALRTLSAELRQDALTMFEARAARLPVLLTLPTILFILPCVFLIAGGPAIIQIMRAFN
ncbi:MAG: type II secretion system F family protein [Acetobacteraceae bacterium]